MILVATLGAAGACGSDEGVAATGTVESPASSSSSGGGGSDLDGGTDAQPDAFAPGPHEPFPVVESLGGPALGKMDIVSIVFSGDPHDATMNDYADWIVTSSWLAEVGKDYGVGAGTHSAHVVLAQAAPATASNTETEALLGQLITDGTLPAPGKDTLYVLVYPSTTTITDFADRPNCVLDTNGMGTLGGYHWEAQVNGTKFPFAVLPTCSTTTDAPIYLEVSASHEIIEAATDPYPVTAPGFVVPDQQSGWAAALVGEVGDLCELLTWSNDNNHWAQPSWSITSAAKSESPCLPAAMLPYYNASLTPSKVQHVKAGASVDLDIRGWSTGPMADWDLSAAGFGDFEPVVSLSQSKLNNGESATLTITVPKGTAPGKMASVFLLSTRSVKTRDFNFWPTAIVVAP